MTGPSPGPPLISVITPTRNRLELLRETMESVAAQTLAAWEHLVVDDGSDDGTAEAVAARVAADPRVRYLVRTGEAAGASVCRNLGLRESRGQLVVFLDSDDLLAPQALARRVEVMARNQDLDFATFQTGVFLETVGDLGRELSPGMLGDDLLRFLFLDVPWQTTAPTWRRGAIEALGGFDEALPSWQDVDLHVRAICGGLRYLRLPEVDHHMRWQFEATKVSIEQRRSPRHLAAADSVLQKFEQVVRAGPGMTWSRQRALCSLYYFVAEHWVAAGHASSGLQTWRQIRRRGLGSPLLHLSGAALLRLAALGGPWRGLAERIAHKWKGWMRLRAEPELVAP